MIKIKTRKTETKEPAPPAPEKSCVPEEFFEIRFFSAFSISFPNTRSMNLRRVRSLKPRAGDARPTLRRAITIAVTLSTMRTASRDGA